jgi:hypothetical protein
VEAHLYIPTSLGRNRLKVRVASWDIPVLPPTLSHWKLSLLTASDPSPLTAHVKEYLCPSLGCVLAAMSTDSGGATWTV